MPLVPPVAMREIIPRSHRDRVLPFVSYAQNFEDVMLWRALAHVETGFYIDVGALSPDHDTVTKAFYERGWHGINIEPNRQYLEILKDRRPKDINLGVAISDTPGTIKLHVLENPGLSTTDEEVAKAHVDSGMTSEVFDVEATTIHEVWKRYVKPDQQVHFLKIDVEGHEREVLRGGDWNVCRPWVLVVEATYPNTREVMHDEWEKILLDTDYVQAYWDGLNKYYVAREHEELLPSFSAPPNVFDDFEIARFSEPVRKLESDLNELRREHEAAVTARESAEQSHREAELAYKDLLEAYEKAQSDYNRAKAALHDVERAYSIEREQNENLRTALDTEIRARQAAEDWLRSAPRSALLRQIFARSEVPPRK